MNQELKFNIYILCKSLSLGQLKSLGFFNMNDENLSTKYASCLTGILTGVIINDTSAKAHLGYQNHQTFQRFKHRFTERVKNYLFLIDTHSKRHQESDKLHVTLWKEVALAQILRKANNTENGFAIFMKTYHKAKQYEYIDIMANCIPPIVTYYSYFSPNKKKYQEALKEKQYTSHHKRKGDLVRRYYDEVSHIASISDLAVELDLAKMALHYYTELLDQFEEGDMSSFRVLASQIGSYGYLTAGSPEKAIEVTLNCIAYLHQKEYVDAVYWVFVYRDLTDAYFKQQNYAECLHYIRLLEELQRSHNHNFFRLKSVKFQILAFTRQYDELYILLHEVTSIRALKKNSVRAEQWQIKTAFVHFLADVGKIDKELIVEKPLNPFRLQRFINDIQHFSKDKRGMNIAVHVIQLLFYLKDKRYDKVSERLESLTQYSHRYLRNDDTLRSNCFIKMLLKLPEADYNPIRTKRYVAKYHQRLLARPLELSMQSSMVEILPYEHLWDIVLELITENSK